MLERSKVLRFESTLSPRDISSNPLFDTGLLVKYLHEQSKTLKRLKALEIIIHKHLLSQHTSKFADIFHDPVNYALWAPRPDVLSVGVMCFTSPLLRVLVRFSLSPLL